MRLFIRTYRGNKGFTLVEVMVAITLLLIVILPLASLYVKSLSTIQGAALYSQALALARSRMELCEGLQYPALDYTNPAFVPGFPFTGPNHPFYYYDNKSASAGFQSYSDNRDNPDTTSVVEVAWDPIEGPGGSDTYPVPMYRDYYNNFTGQLIDPNYNGLCDDDLNGDGIVDSVDILIGDPNNDVYPAGAKYAGQPRAGDGIYDTVVEGLYANSFDPTQFRNLKNQEVVTPIIDFSLQLDNEQLVGPIQDYRHREKTFRNFVRMTTIIDPTPTLADPTHPDAYDDWVDQYYFWLRRTSDFYTDKQLLTLSLCLERDLPLMRGTDNLTVGVGGDTIDVASIDNGAGLVQTDPFKMNYAAPLYGKKVIVTVFYLSGKAEVVYEDLDNDGIPEEIPDETYANARHVSLFYQGRIVNRDPSYTIPGLVQDTSGNRRINGIQLVPPQRRFTVDTSINTPDGAVEIPDIRAGDEYDPCAEDNDGLPYLGDRYWH
jgi:prepilin-type N-terminal cleavage/methylation domain-containing protein